MTTQFIREMREAEAKADAEKLELWNERKKMLFMEKYKYVMEVIIAMSADGAREVDIAHALGIKHSTMASIKFRMRKHGIGVPRNPRGLANKRYGLDASISIVS